MEKWNTVWSSFPQSYLRLSSHSYLGTKLIHIEMARRLETQSQSEILWILKSDDKFKEDLKMTSLEFWVILSIRVRKTSNLSFSVKVFWYNLRVKKERRTRKKFQLDTEWTCNVKNYITFGVISFCMENNGWRSFVYLYLQLHLLCNSIDPNLEACIS